MPNGGSDCCGTCWFNAKNKGQAGYEHDEDPEPARCLIRGDVEIPDPFWTYCANHPHRNPTRLALPIGPIFRSVEATDPEELGVETEVIAGRWVWLRSPDTPEIRETLLKLLGDAADRPRAEYPAGLSLPQVAIWQLVEFRETRAIPYLERIAAIDPEHKSGEPGLGAFARGALQWLRSTRP